MVVLAAASHWAVSVKRPIRPLFFQLLAIQLYDSNAPNLVSSALSWGQQMLPFPKAEDHPNTISLLPQLALSIRSIDIHFHCGNNCISKHPPTRVLHIGQTANCLPTKHRLSRLTIHNTAPAGQIVDCPAFDGYSVYLQVATHACQPCAIVHHLALLLVQLLFIMLYNLLHLVSIKCLVALHATLRALLP